MLPKARTLQLNLIELSTDNVVKGIPYLTKPKIAICNPCQLGK